MSSQTKVRDWLSMSREELDAIYKQSKSGAIPKGDTRGTAILTGTAFPELFATFARKLAWQGKIFDLFDADKGVLVNKVSPLGVRTIVAKVYRDISWIDGKDTIVIDYAKTSFFAQKIRDEIREVEPGLYLGKVWWANKRVLDFALETCVDAATSACPFSKAA